MADHPMAQPPVKVYKSDDRLTVAALMPGIEPQDIEVALSESGELRLLGRQRGIFKGQKNVLLDEWDAGYDRTLAFSDAVDGTAANATYENGVLVVSLPLSSSFKPARIGLDRLGATEGRHAGLAGHPPI